MTDNPLVYRCEACGREYSMVATLPVTYRTPDGNRCRTYGPSNGPSKTTFPGADIELS